MTSKPAVVLLSGGLDSATVLAVARREGFACHALTVAYASATPPSWRRPAASPGTSAPPTTASPTSTCASSAARPSPPTWRCPRTGPPRR